MAHVMRATVIATLCSVLVAGCARPAQATPHHPTAQGTAAPEPPPDYPVVPPGGTQPAPPPPAGLSVATFAGGCFWCMESAFEHVPGVRDAISGYTGGPEQHPDYDAVSNHRTQQAESVRVLFDPRVVTYEQLLDVYWRHVDPIDADQAFSDTGHQYRSEIFVHDAAQRAAAERSIQQINASHRFERPVLTRVEDAPVFWVAEDYHQNYWRTHPEQFNEYHDHSGRREFIRAHWGPNAPY